jgi:quinol monooxygenase YgiN
MSIRCWIRIVALSWGAVLALPTLAAPPPVPPSGPPPDTSDVDRLAGPAVITEISIYRAHAGHEAEIAKLLQGLSDAARQEKGNIASSLHRSLGGAHDFLLYQQFETRAALNAHRATASYKQTISNLQKAATLRFSEEFTPLLPG